MEQNLEFEREKWRADLDIRQREVALKESEQANRNAEIELKRLEQASSKWRSPLIVAIFAAAAAAGGNAVVALINGNEQRKVEDRRHVTESTLAEAKHVAEIKLAEAKHLAEIKLESSKAESTRIFEMIKTGDPDRAASNLDFLLKSGLITEPDRVSRMAEYLANRKPGTGTSLPSTTSRIGFEPTELLTESLQSSLQKQLENYIEYLDKIGFPNIAKKVSIKIDKLQSPNAYYTGNTIVIDTRMSTDPVVALREYNHHVLMARESDRLWERQFAAIESALADYFACSFLNNPKVGEIAAKAFDPKRAYIRILDNKRKFREFDAMRHESEIKYQGSEIWGGAFWEIREKIGRDKADPVLVAAWLATSWPDDEVQRAPAFVKTLLSAARPKLSDQDFTLVQSALQAREFPLPR